MIQIVIHHNNQRIFVTEETSEIAPDKLEFLLNVYKRLEGVRVSSEVKEVLDSVDQSNEDKNAHKQPNNDKYDKNRPHTEDKEENTKETTLNEI